METYQGRYALLRGLNWLGECGFTPLQLWDFKAETTRDDRVMGIFVAGAQRRYESVKESLNELIDAAENCVEDVSPESPTKNLADREDRSF